MRRRKLSVNKDFYWFYEGVKGGRPVSLYECLKYRGSKKKIQLKKIKRDREEHVNTLKKEMLGEVRTQREDIINPVMTVFITRPKRRGRF